MFASFHFLISSRPLRPSKQTFQVEYNFPIVLVLPDRAVDLLLTGSIPETSPTHPLSCTVEPGRLQ